MKFHVGRQHARRARLLAKGRRTQKNQDQRYAQKKPVSEQLQASSHIRVKRTGGAIVRPLVVKKRLYAEKMDRMSMGMNKP